MGDLTRRSLLASLAAFAMFATCLLSKGALADDTPVILLPAGAKATAATARADRARIEVSIEGWIVENGAAVSREKYRELFAVIGISYGAGDGATTFNLPTHGTEFRGGQVYKGFAINPTNGQLPAGVSSPFILDPEI
jgi:hypothetical protein